MWLDTNKYFETKPVSAYVLTLSDLSQGESCLIEGGSGDGASIVECLVHVVLLMYDAMQPVWMQLYA